MTISSKGDTLMKWQKDDSYFREKTASSELIFDGSVLHLYKDTIILPDGQYGMREYCKHNGAVAVVPLTKDNQVICVRQYRYALGRVTLEIPAGKFDFVGEDHLEAALRELREETGYTPGKITDIGCMATSPALLTEIIYIYMAEDLSEGDVDPDPDEFLEIVKIPLEDMVDMILKGEIQDAKTQTAVIKAWAIKKKESQGRN